MTPILRFLKDNATVITPHTALTDDVLRDFMRHHSQKIAPKPRCLSYAVFINQLATHMPDAPILLSTEQTEILWAKTLRSLMDQNIHHNTQKALLKAYVKCLNECISFNHPLFDMTPQTRQFSRAAQAMETALHTLNAMTEHHIVSFIMQQKKPPYNLSYLLESPLVWYAFHAYTPSQQALQVYFKEHGIPSEHLDIIPINKTAACYIALDEIDELQQITALINKAHTENPHQRITIVMPRLDEKKDKLKLYLPKEIIIQQPNAFITYPLIYHACILLKLDKTTPLSAEDAALLLYSPYIGDATTESLQRFEAQQDDALFNEPSVPIKKLIEKTEPIAPLFAARIKNIVDYPKEASPHLFGICFKQRLQTIGFPGTAFLTSDQHALYQALDTLIQTFQSLTLVCPQMSYQEAVMVFEQLATNKPWHETPAHPPKANILSLEQALGRHFDILWIAQFSDDNPRSPPLSPYIPLELQMNNLSPVDDLACIIQKLKANSQYVYFSCPLYIDGTPSRLSPFLDDLPSYQPLPYHIPTHPSYLEPIEESYILPLQHATPAKGGTALLSYQAQCPFRAFAAHRLKLRKKNPTSDGLSPAERGNILHAIQEELWQTIKNHHTLMQLSENALQTLIEQAIYKALAPYKALRPMTFIDCIQHIEKERLNTLVGASLTFEKSRLPFNVTALEQTITLPIGSLSLTLRIDRIDTDAQGHQWVIDYKTTPPLSMPWQEERPQEVQMLLYALTDESIKYLLFLGLKDAKVTIKGLSEWPVDIPGMRALKKGEQLESLKQEWKEKLESLANEYTNGHCMPSPQNPSICSRCDYQNLCRTHR